MTEFTSESIAEYRKYVYLKSVLDGIKFSHVQKLAILCLDEIERLQAELVHMENKKQTVFEIMQNTIARRDKRIAELEHERRWIPVSERLPEDSRIYDVAISGYPYSWTGSCVFGKWIGESGKAILGITHWKYRPQPPQEES